MNNQEAIRLFKEYRNCLFGILAEPIDMAIKALEQNESAEEWYKLFVEKLEQEPKIGHCKECKFFEYDSVSKIDGVPLIVAHEICNKWGDGCKTKEDGFCFLFEPRESEVEDGAIRNHSRNESGKDDC